MLNTRNTQPIKFDGNCGEIFPNVWKALANRLQGTNVKNEAIALYPISLHRVFVMGFMSNCPDKSLDFQNGWTMKELEICYQNGIFRPDPYNALYREILRLEAFEVHLFDSSDKGHVIAFHNSTLLIVLEYLKIISQRSIKLIVWTRSVYSDFFSRFTPFI
jgi:hypothetical protein